MSEETRRLARELRGHFRAGARTGRTGPLYTPILNILVEGRTDAEAAEIYFDYQRQFDESFERDLRAFIARVQEDMRQHLTDSFLVRIRQAGVNPLGGPAMAPPAVSYSGTAQQIQEWRTAFLQYFRSRQATTDVNDAAVQATAIWVLDHWTELHEATVSTGGGGPTATAGAWRNLVTTCGWMPAETQIFRASFSILSQNSRSIQVGRTEGVRYFRGIRDAIRSTFNDMMSEAAQYQETYQARCFPHQHALQRLQGNAPTSPVDSGNVVARMHAWNDLLTHCGATNFPVLSDAEKGYVRRLPALARCWTVPPAPGHTCATEAARAHCGTSSGVL